MANPAEPSKDDIDVATKFLIARALVPERRFELNAAVQALVKLQEQASLKKAELRVAEFHGSLEQIWRSSDNASVESMTNAVLASARNLPLLKKVVTPGRAATLAKEFKKSPPKWGESGDGSEPKGRFNEIRASTFAPIWLALNDEYGKGLKASIEKTSRVLNRELERRLGQEPPTEDIQSKTVKGPKSYESNALAVAPVVGALDGLLLVMELFEVPTEGRKAVALAYLRYLELPEECLDAAKKRVQSRDVEQEYRTKGRSADRGTATLSSENPD